MDYNLKIIHEPGTLNHTDALSQCPDFDDGKGDNADITALSDELFIRHMETITIYKEVAEAQKGDQGRQIEEWVTKHKLEFVDGLWFKMEN